MAALKKHRPDPADVHVGARLRLRRTMMGITQAELGKVVGVSFQQIQKYEKGGNRISAGRLSAFAEFLGVPITYFYEGLEQAPAKTSAKPQMAAGMGEDRETLNALRALVRIKDERVRRSIRALLSAIADAADPDGR